MKKRNSRIDFIKGILICLVIIGHYYAPSVIRYAIWSFHMPMFVIISGFFFKPGINRTKTLGYVKKNLNPYFIVWLFIGFARMINDVIHRKKIEISCFTIWLKSLLYAAGSNSESFLPQGVVKVGAIWFLMALFWSHIILSVITKMHHSIYKCVTITIGILIVGTIMSYYYNLPLGFLKGIAFLPWLLIGYIIRLNEKKYLAFIQKHDYLCICISIVIWFSIVMFEWKNDICYSVTNLNPLIPFLGYITTTCALTISCIFVPYIKEDDYIYKIFVQIGQNSLIILCVHSLVIELFSSLFSKIYIHDCISMLIRLVLDIYFAYVIKSAIDKIKKYYGKGCLV